MYNILLFDADETLFDFRRAERVAYDATMSAAGAPSGDSLYSLYSRINDSLWQLLNAGGITREALAVERWRRYAQEASLELEPSLLNEMYIERLAACPYLFDGALELCRTLHSAGKRLFLISNGIGRVQRGRFALCGLAPYFERCFISEDIGASKPSREYFEHVFAEIEGFDRERAVVIGDSLSADIRGGKNAGVDTIWYNPQGATPPEELRPDMTVSSLAELGRLILEEGSPLPDGGHRLRFITEVQK